MGVMKKLFPSKKGGKNGKDDLDNQAKLKLLTRKLDLKLRDFSKKSTLCKIKAKEFLKAGNRVAAKNMLAREKQFAKKITQYSGMIMKTERYLDSLEQAKTMTEVADGWEGLGTELQAAAGAVNVERAMQITETAEESLDQIEEAGELFSSDPELDFGMDLDEDLEQLEAELMLEQAGGLPSTPVGVAEPISMSLYDDGEEDSEVKSAEALEDEISKLKKELDI